MKNTTVFIFAGWLFLSVAYAQKTKEVTKHDNPFTEKYSVLKADKRTRQGPYRRYFRETLIEKGTYNQESRVGVWEFYDTRGNLNQKFDYDARQVLYAADYDRPDSLQTLYTVISHTDTSFVRLARPPVPIGGSSQLAQILMTNMRYPISAMRAGKQGIVAVQFVVDETGQFGPAHIIRSSGARDMDEEALRVINLYSALHWIPAELNGRKVSTVMTQPVRFNYMGIVNGTR